MGNSPLVAPVNRPLFADARCERGVGQPRLVVGQNARGRGVVGAGVNRGGDVTRGVSPTGFARTGPFANLSQIFSGLPGPRTSAARAGFHLPMEMT